MGLVLMGVGAIMMLVFGIWLLILAFQEHILWGLAYLFIPFAALVFVIMHFEHAGKPFFGSLGGTVLFFAGSAMAGSA